jgi:RNA polymerase sigma factor (sigma-70 family)
MTTSGDPTVGLAELYRTHHEPMVRMARLMIGTSEEAEEVVHDAFIAVHHRWATLTEPGAYLRVCVVNRSRNVLRSRSRARRTGLDALNNEPYALLPGEPSVVDGALAALGERQRVALVLRYYEDLTVEDVAKVLGCRRGAAASLINRALKQMREVL